MQSERRKSSNHNHSANRSAEADTSTTVPRSSVAWMAGHIVTIVSAIIILALPQPLCSNQSRQRYIDITMTIREPSCIPLNPSTDKTNRKQPKPEPPFHDLIMRAAETYQVDATLIQAIILAESSYNPKAVSHRGAQGLMQLMPATARWLGVGDPFDPALNIDAGVRYFKQLLKRYKGNVELALAAYNAGGRNVRKYGGVPPFAATRLYIDKVLKQHRIYQEGIKAAIPVGDTREVVAGGI